MTPGDPDGVRPSGAAVPASAAAAPADRPEVYLDHSATTPMRAEVAQAVAEAGAVLWGNPSSVHASGRRARAALEEARRRVAGLLGGNPHHWVFTSGGTEANNLAVQGVARAAGRLGRRHLVLSAVEHHSVLDAADALGRDGWEVRAVPPGPDGRVAAADVLAALGPDTALCCLMAASNEVAAVQPVREVAEGCRAAGVPLHVDAVAAAGRLPVRVEDLGADLLSVSAHKIYGPKGVGALYIRPGLEIEPLLHGGGQERRWRPGTENVAGIVGFGVAAERAEEDLAAEGPRLRALGAELVDAVLSAGVGAVATGPTDWAYRVPGLASFVFPGLDGEALLVSLDLQGVRASAGSACASGALRPSHVLLAMGLRPEAASAALRLSLGRGSGSRHVAAVVGALRAAVGRQASAHRTARSPGL